MADGDLIIKTEPWMKSPSIRWDKGLERAGRAWHNVLNKYPPGPPSRSGFGHYARTGTLGNKAEARLVTAGKLLELWGVVYTKYALLGIGIHGPKGTPIVPVHAKMLAWKGKSGMMLFSSGLSKKGETLKHKKSGDSYLTFARSSSGYKWYGKLEELTEQMIKEFKAGIKENK